MSGTKRLLNAKQRLPDVVRRLLSVTGGDVIIHEVCVLAKSMLGVDEVSLFLADGSGENIVEHEVVAKKLRATRHHLKVGGEGITGSVASSKKPAVVADVRKDKRYLKTYESTRSEAAVPIVAGDRLLGVLNFESNHLGYFRNTDLPLLEILAAQLAIALRLESLERRAVRWQERLAAVQNIARLGGGVASMETMMKRVVDTVRTECGGHYAAIYRADYDRRELVRVAQSGAQSFDDASEGRLKFGTGVIGRAFDLGEVVNVKDVRRETMYVLRVPGVRSQLCVPIRVGDRPVGILDAEGAQVGEFTDDELTFLETVARMIAPSFQSPVPVGR